VSTSHHVMPVKEHALSMPRWWEGHRREAIGVAVGAQTYPAQNPALCEQTTSLRLAQEFRVSASEPLFPYTNVFRENQLV
jgi:hypothetical protein